MRQFSELQFVSNLCPKTLPTSSNFPVLLVHRSGWFLSIYFAWWYRSVDGVK